MINTNIQYAWGIIPIRISIYEMGPQKGIIEFDMENVNTILVRELIQIISGTLLNENADLEKEIKGGFAADLMSDVLASIRPEAVLITGLCNPQVIRTSVMADISAIVLVRGKMPPSETIQLASQELIPLISSPCGMYEVCGRLSKLGLPSFEDMMTNEYMNNPHPSVDS